MEQIILWATGAVERAEKARADGNVRKAARIAYGALQSEDIPLLVKACLARIHVDAEKTAANHELLPSKALPSLERAANTINTMYRKPEFEEAIRPAEKDHTGRPHFFWAEMQRDRASVLFAVALLQNREKRRELIEQGEHLLDQTWHDLPDNHPTKPLIGIEYELHRIVSGSSNLDLETTERLFRNFDELLKRERTPNPHRVASVAARIIAVSERTNNNPLFALGLLANSVLWSIRMDHSDWGFILKDARKKLMLEPVRAAWFSLAAPLTISPDRLNTLYKICYDSAL